MLLPLANPAAHGAYVAMQALNAIDTLGANAQAVAGCHRGVAECGASIARAGAHGIHQAIARTYRQDTGLTL